MGTNQTPLGESSSKVKRLRRYLKGQIDFYSIQSSTEARIHVNVLNALLRFTDEMYCPADGKRVSQYDEDLAQAVSEQLEVDL